MEVRGNSNSECVSDGNFEGGIVLKVRDSKRGRSEFVAVIYGEIDRPRVNVYVTPSAHKGQQKTAGPISGLGIRGK